MAALMSYISTGLGFPERPYSKHPHYHDLRRNDCDEALGDPGMVDEKFV